MQLDSRAANEFVSADGVADEERLAQASDGDARVLWKTQEVAELQAPAYQWG